MKQGLLDNCREFYQDCLIRGRIPVSKWGKRWFYSHDPEDFENYLAKFSPSERRYITEGLPKPGNGFSTRTATIAASLRHDKIVALIAKIQESDPEALERIRNRIRQ